VFGNLSQIYYSLIPYTPTADEVALANDMMDYWSRFAATGDPNGEGTRRWLPYDAKHDNVFRLDVTKSTIKGYHNDRCDYLNALPFPSGP
jgi:carboxylesterase type B